MTGGKSCVVCKIVGLLVGVGAVNWGLVGAFHFNLVTKLLGEASGKARAVYILIGIAGLLKLLSMVKCCPCQKTDAACGSKK